MIFLQKGLYSIDDYTSHSMYIMSLIVKLFEVFVSISLLDVNEYMKDHVFELRRKI